MYNRLTATVGSRSNTVRLRHYHHLNRIHYRADRGCCCFKRKRWKATTTVWGLLYLTTTSQYFQFGRAMSTITSSSSSSSATYKAQKIAVGQVCSTSSKWNNLVNAAMCAGWASKERSTMLFLPECFGFLGSNAEETLRAAEPSSTTIISNPDIVRNTLINIVQECSTLPRNVIPNNCIPSSSLLQMNDGWKLSLIDGLRVIAQASHLWISAGSIHVLCPDEETINDTDDDDDDDNNNNNNTGSCTGHSGRRRRHVYNTHIIMDHMGIIRSEYRKIHLFDVCIPEQNVDLRESKTTRSGTELVTCSDSPIGCLGVTVCYDLRFPEMYTKFVQTMNVKVLLIPSAFTVPTGHAHWHTLLKARAIENQCYVIAAAQYGQHNEKRISYGHSLVVDGWGTIIADAGGMDSVVKPTTEQPTIITCEIDLSTIDSIRERMPLQQHRTNAQF